MEEELLAVREEKKVQRDELIGQEQALRYEQNAVIQQHAEQMSRLGERMKALRDRPGKDSHHSALPPSWDRWGHKPKSLGPKSEKKSGGQAGHPETGLPFSSTPDEITQLPVERCDICQQDLQAVAACGRERRQVVDLPPPRLVVREYQAEQKQCPHCHSLTIAAFPSGVQAPIQYGRQVAATAVYLVEQQLLPLARACEVMGDLLGVHMSEGTVWELIKRCAGQLAPVEQQFTGISIHDAWSSSFLYDCEQALCLVHVLRDLVFLAEQGLVWAADLKSLLLDMKAATDQARTGQMAAGATRSRGLGSAVSAPAR